MRKIRPVDVRRDFRDSTVDLVGFMNRATVDILAGSGSKADASRLAAMTFLDLYVNFERFLSDLFLAYLNRNFTQYQADLEQRFLQSTELKFGQWCRGRVAFNSISHVNVDTLETIVDPTGWNLTFKDAQAIRDKAGQWLVTNHRNRVHSLSPEDERLIDTARCVRDFIAHQSRGAKDRMNQALATVGQGGANANLVRGTRRIDNVGSYLKSVFAGQSRVAIYADRLKAIAQQM